MKSTLLWSLTALCGVVGGVVAWNGGWRSISLTWTPIRITKVVWVTNEMISATVKDSPWSKPLKPLEPEQTFDQKAWRTNEYGHRIPVNTFWMTNTLIITNSTHEPRMVTVGPGGTNGLRVNPLEALYITNLIISSNSISLLHSYATNHYGF